ncbi:asparaginase [Leptolyngbya sp. FACHB-711]|uniref:asparaginase n=1 Tax=unclassified Leptolyngbya TaxID=2650499 RepID=UPI0016838C21|nr:asparaginase [Leptolyngbya sp. FACHB-711]MBD1853537.1 asparaginase [Cyanobacteria bacterium FACHB-502]MBD2024436.1 asparaginase [Leptolyngbya sp. FACHB-711]
MNKLIHRLLPGIFLVSPAALAAPFAVYSLPVTSLATNSSEVRVAQAETATELPKVKILTTGGTIASRGATPLTLSDYTAGRVEGNALVEAVPEIQNFANVEVEEIANIGSPDMTSEIWLKMAKRINEIFATEPDVAGVVITHGTNTLEETSFFLHLTVQSDKPVVLVGAQRPATAISADGPLNLINAVRVAAAPHSRGMGALLVMNDQINSARDVTKTNTFRLETFQSGELGFLGYADSDRVVYYRSPMRRHTVRSEFDITSVTELPRVDVVYSYAEASRDTVDALVEAGTKGIILAGTGAGGAAPREFEGLKEAVQRGVTVIASSRVGNGRVLDRQRYVDAGIIPGDNLLPQKARILLMLALTQTSDPAEIRRIFEEY